MAAIALRPYQEEGVANIRDAFKRKNYPTLFVLPTGGGKTYTFCYIASNAAEKGNNVVIIVHRKELLLQASKSLKALGIDHGIISPHFTASPHKMVQVASIDTLIGRVRKWPEKYRFKLAIYDEAHHVTKVNKWGKLHELLGMPITLGVTATPKRGDGTGLGEGHGGIFKEMVIGPLVPELIEMGMLINPTVYTCLNPPSFDDLKTNVEGEYNAKDVEDRVDRPVIIGSAVAHYTEICPGSTAIVFCASIKHAKHVVAEFNAAGYKFALLVGEPEMSDGERTEVNRALAAGELHGACTVALVDEGYDLPALQVCIGLAPTASESRFLQRVGRIMRPAPGKSSANTWYLDHVGDVGRQVDGSFKVKHGLPAAHRNWSLEGKKKGKKKPTDEVVKMMQCPECFHVFDPLPKCPGCGHDMAPTARQIEQIEGRLLQVTAEMEAATKQAAQNKQAARSNQASAKTVEDLMRLGYPRARAIAVVRAREEKKKLIDDLVEDLRAWREQTGESSIDVLGVAIADIRSLTAKPLKELRAKLDEHRTTKNKADALGFIRQHATQELQF